MKKYTIVIAGGGSTFTPGVVKALLSKKNEFKLKELRVYDIDPERQRKISVITRQVIKEMDPEVEFSEHSSPETAFENADFVFAQIRTGKYFITPGRTLYTSKIQPIWKPKTIRSEKMASFSGMCRTSSLFRRKMKNIGM